MSIISKLKETTQRTNQLDKDIRAFFQRYELTHIADHTARVAENARLLAERFGISSDLTLTAAYLHDTGLVLPKDQFILAANEYGIEVFEEESLFPGLLHQKLSKAIASDIFGIQNSSVLDAIECHTTLKAGASDIALILFVADKLSWDVQDSKQIMDGIQDGLKKSLAHAAFSYIKYSLENKEKLSVLHRWFEEAYNELKQSCP